MPALPPLAGISPCQPRGAASPGQSEPLVCAGSWFQRRAPFPVGVSLREGEPSSPRAGLVEGMAALSTTFDVFAE